MNHPDDHTRVRTPYSPAAATFGPDSPRARGGDQGLILVAALTEEWGVTVPEGAQGKTVWAVVGVGVPR